MLIRRLQSGHRSTFYNCRAIEIDDPSNLCFELIRPLFHFLSEREGGRTCLIYFNSITNNSSLVHILILLTGHFFITALSALTAAGVVAAAVFASSVLIYCTILQRCSLLNWEA